MQEEQREGELFAEVFQSSPVMMVIVDEQRKVHQANRAAVEFIGRPPEELKGLRAGHALGCLYALDDERGCGNGPHCKECLIRDSVVETHRTGLERYRVLASVPVSVGNRQELLRLLVSTKVITLQERLVLVTLENVTDLMRNEESLKEFNEHLRLINSIMRHDVKSDLRILSASLHKTEERIEPYADEKVRELMRKASTAIDRTGELIDKMQELEGTIPSETGLKPIDLRKAFSAVLGKYQVQSRVRGEGTALADDALVSVFDNIVANAITHGKTEKIDIDITSDPDVCEVRIADSGTGIPSEIKGRIFEKGFTMERGRGHTGLGLYIAQSVVRRYGGSILVEDNKPKGAAFVILLKTPRKTLPN